MCLKGRRTSSGKYYISLQCCDLTTIVRWGEVFPHPMRPAIGRDDEFVLIRSKDDYRSGIDLGLCYTADKDTKKENGFRVIVHANNGFVDFDPFANIVTLQIEPLPE